MPGIGDTISQGHISGIDSRNLLTTQQAKSKEKQNCRRPEN